MDCIAEYNNVTSIIDFKTSTKERNDEWNRSYYIQASAYAEMFEERTGTEINQIVILVVTEDGVVQEFVKTKDEYLPKLIEAIDDFTTHWEKENEQKLDEGPDVIGSCLVVPLSQNQKIYQRKKLNHPSNSRGTRGTGNVVLGTETNIVFVWCRGNKNYGE